MSEGVVDTTGERLVGVVERMAALPWPEAGGSPAWEIDGLAGSTDTLAHTLPLGTTTDPGALRALTRAFTSAADRRWSIRFRLDARERTDTTAMEPADRREAPGAAVRALGADTAIWWRFRDHAVLLVDTSTARPAPPTCTASVLVLDAQWLAQPADDVAPLPVGGVADGLIADFVSRDSRRVLHAVWEVFTTRDPAVLRPLARAYARIDRATDDLDLGGMLISNGSNLAHALDRIRIFGEGRCLCTAYAGHVRYEPAKEESYGHVRIVEEIPVFYNGRPDRPRRICVCVDCDRRYEVEEGEYHYTWWKWTARAAEDSA